MLTYSVVVSALLVLVSAYAWVWFRKAAKALRDSADLMDQASDALDEGKAISDILVERCVHLSFELSHARAMQTRGKSGLN